MQITPLNNECLVDICPIPEVQKTRLKPANFLHSASGLFQESTDHIDGFAISTGACCTPPLKHKVVLQKAPG